MYRFYLFGRFRLFEKNNSLSMGLRLIVRENVTRIGLGYGMRYTNYLKELDGKNIKGKKISNKKKIANADLFLFFLRATYPKSHYRSIIQVRIMHRGRGRR